MRIPRLKLLFKQKILELSNSGRSLLKSKVVEFVEIIALFFVL